ncbi:MAG: amino acid ABC transporter permease [Clostridiales bacterium]|nr:amino acid ABC transporter permease [Clostridiales bacterium]
MPTTFFPAVWYILENYGSWFLRGAGITMLIALTGTVIGFIIGLGVGVVRTIPAPRGGKFSLKKILLKLSNILLNIYIEVFRGTPMMVQAMVIYFGLSEAIGVNLSPLTAGIIIVSINTGAYMAEVVRGGIQSIDKGQTEAARSIGMNHTKTMLHVILPQAIRNILPATGNEFVINIKDTSVLNVISVVELYFQTKSVRGALFKTYEVFLITAAIYFVLTFTVTRLLRLVEKKMDGPSGYTIFTSSTMPQGRLLRGRRGKETAV